MNPPPLSPSQQQTNHSIMEHGDEHDARRSSCKDDVRNNDTRSGDAMPSCIHMLEDHDFPSLDITKKKKKAGLDPENGIGYRGSPFGGHGPLGQAISPVELARSRVIIQKSNRSSPVVDDNEAPTMHNDNDEFQRPTTTNIEIAKPNTKKKQHESSSTSRPSKSTTAATIAKLQRKLLNARIDESKVRSHWIYKLLEDRRQLNIKLVQSRAERQLQYQALVKEHEEIVKEMQAEYDVKYDVLRQELQRQRVSEVEHFKTELEFAQQQLLDMQTRLAGESSSSSSILSENNSKDDDEDQILSTMREEMQKQFTEQRTLDAKLHAKEISILRTQLIDAVDEAKKQEVLVVKDEYLKEKELYVLACTEREESLQVELRQLKEELRIVQMNSSEKDALVKRYQDEVSELKVQLQDLLHGEQMQKLEHASERRSPSAAASPTERYNYHDDCQNKADDGVDCNDCRKSDDDDDGSVNNASASVADHGHDENNNFDLSVGETIVEHVDVDREVKYNDGAEETRVCDDVHEDKDNDDDDDEGEDDVSELSLAQRVSRNRRRPSPALIVLEPVHANEWPDEVVTEAKNSNELNQFIAKKHDDDDQEVEAVLRNDDCLPRVTRRQTRSASKLLKQIDHLASVETGSNINHEVLEEEGEHTITSRRTQRSLLSSKPLREVTTRKRKQKNVRRQSLIETGQLQSIEEEGSVFNDDSFTSQTSSLSSSSSSSKENQLNSSMASTSSEINTKRRRKGQNSGLLSSFTAPKLKSKRNRRRC